MAQLNVRLDDYTRDEFDALARAKGTNASDLIRGLIDEALGRGTERERGDVTPRSLSAVQRRALALLHGILADLTNDPEQAEGGSEAEYHQRMVEVLERGYELEYSDLFISIQPEMSRRECTLVMDILDLFTTIGRTVDNLSEADLAEIGPHAKYALRFRGFDFNNSQEGRMASYAEFLIRTGRWENMAEYFDRAHDRGNSHSPTLASYERMLAVWRPMWKAKIAKFGAPTDYLFTAEELKDIYAAWPYPQD
jgi:uncharacterized protein